MVITINEENTQLTLTSDLLSNWIALIGEVNEPTLTLTYTYNCEEVVDIEVSEETVDIVEEEMVLSDVLPTTEDLISRGIYYFTLKYVDADTDEITYEYLCYFVGYDLDCEITEYLTDNLSSNIYAYYQVLTNLNVCTECPCTSACVIFEALMDKLQEETTSNCGCQ